MSFARAAAALNVKQSTLSKRIAALEQHLCVKLFVTNNVLRGGQLHTDELNSYRGLHLAGYRHMTVNHGAGGGIMRPPIVDRRIRHSFE